MIRNYTSSVPAVNSISFIEQKLAAFGASDILKRYDAQKRLCGLCFMVEIEGRRVPFKLPARVQECEEALLAEVIRKRSRPLKNETRESIRQQSERTAWKIMSDWVVLQLTMIELQQVKFFEVFMPFVFNAATNQTYYERLEETKFKQLLPPEENNHES